MKIRILSIILAVITFLSSCDLDGEANYTPDIFFIHNPVNLGKDTLNRYYTDKSGVYRMDTIEVGDTVLFNVYLEGYANNLTGFYLVQSADSVSKIVFPNVAAMDSLFLPTSDYSKGKFLMDGTHPGLIFPFYYIALKHSLEAKINFAVTSDANFDNGFGTNTNSFELKTPIIPKKTQLE
jgi:hypothetical protein